MKPEILVRGNDPNCVHYSDIVGPIGTCRKCGQVLDYSRCQGNGKNELLAAKGRKGGKAYAALYSD